MACAVGALPRLPDLARGRQPQAPVERRGPIDGATRPSTIAQGASPAIFVGAGGPTVAYLASPGRGNLMFATGSDVTRLAGQADDPVLILGHGGPLAIWESDGSVHTAILINGQRP